MTWQIITADVLEGLAQLPDASVQTVVTSPPYWGLRDYGTAEWEGGDAACDHLKQSVRDVGERKASTLVGTTETIRAGEFAAAAYRERCGKCGAVRKDQQLGLEPTPEAYVSRMVDVFREVKRVLRRDGTCWVNLGDSYASTGAGSQTEQTAYRTGRAGGDPRGPARKTVGQLAGSAPMPPGLKPKDLVGIPWRVAFALQADGWFLRSDVIWAKPNPMPESVTDRPTKAHEYVFLLTRSARYFYDADAVREPHLPVSLARVEKPLHHKHPDDVGVGIPPVDTERMGERFAHPNGRNMRSVWSIPTEPFPQAHFATFPKALVVPCIKAGTSEKGACPECGAAWVRQVEQERRPWERDNRAWGEGRGPVDDDKPSGPKLQAWLNEHPPKTIGWKPSCSHDLDPAPCLVLDPFAGSGTVGLVALRYGRSFVGIELNPDYAEMARNRIRDDGPLFNVGAEVPKEEVAP